MLDPKTSMSVAMFIFAFLFIMLFAIAWRDIANLYQKHKAKQAEIKKGQTIWRRKD